jgi:hypothetical protein
MPVDDKTPDDIVVDYARELAEQLSAVVAHKRRAQEKAGPLRSGSQTGGSRARLRVLNRWAASASRIGAGNK